jgi:geranylgeranyl transferase type-2 subunit alpha
MHGVTKASFLDVPPEKLAARAKKTEQYKALAKEVLRRRAERIYDDKSFALTSKMLEVNPECYTVWNFRREMLTRMLDGKGEADLRAICERELSFLEGALMKNPKAYTTWEHRLWTVRRHGAAAAAELLLCDKFLKFDERNFHCWGYRRHMARLAAAAPSAELAFTDAKVESNFSNYSAWHSRTKLLPAMHTDEPPAAFAAAIEAEFELLQQAFFTEPDDQSSWCPHAPHPPPTTPPPLSNCLRCVQPEW